MMNFFRKRNKHKSPEYSKVVRYLVLAAMLVPLVSLLRVRSSLLIPILISAVGMGLGHWHSYHNLEKDGRVLKGIMFVAIHVALAWLCVGLFVGTPVPQAQFAVLAQAITSFDLRYRSSLFNTLIHSMANLYIAASLSRTLELGLYLLLFAIFVLAAFYVAAREDGLRKATLTPVAKPTKQATKSRFQILGFGASFMSLTVLAIFVVFLFTPRFANRPLVPPFSIDVPLNGGVKAEIINPGIPLVQINGWNDGKSDYFYGFDSSLDLRYRGGLSDAVVMYVRSPSRSYWRSHSYDTYTGTGWEQQNKAVTAVRNRGNIYYRLPRVLGAASEAKLSQTTSDQAGQEIVQTYTIVREQPNLIFAAYRPAEIFIFTEELSVDSGDGLRVPEPLKAGMTYSVVSYRPDFQPDLLRQASGEYPADINNRYLQLPATVTERTRQLARTLTASYHNQFDQVTALNQHLLTQYPYNFYPPPHPEGADVVDTFLFADREGICEQYVTALVVMARSLGIPSRLVTGYGSGDYNQLTGYYEVRASDAHSWAEIYFPNYGWVPFDPTPGWIPQPYPTPVQTWLFSSYGNALLELDLPIAGMIATGLAGVTAIGPLLIGAILTFIGLMMLAFFYRRLRKIRLGQRQQNYSHITTDRHRRHILQRYCQATRLLARYKYGQRETWQTAQEYARQLEIADETARPALQTLTQAAEVAAYRPAQPTEKTVSQAEASWRKLKRIGKKKRMR